MVLQRLPACPPPSVLPTQWGSLLEEKMLALPSRGLKLNCRHSRGAAGIPKSTGPGVQRFLAHWPSVLNKHFLLNESQHWGPDSSGQVLPSLPLHPSPLISKCGDR